MKRRLAALPAVALAAVSLVAGIPAGAHTAGPVSACADSYQGSQGSCAFQYIGIRLAPWAIPSHDSTSVVVEVRLPLESGGYAVLASCTAFAALPCVGESVARLRPESQAVKCHARGTGRAVFGCFSQKPVLSSN